MKKFLNCSLFLLLTILFSNCSENQLDIEQNTKNYSYNIEDIYTKKSALKFKSKSSVSDITYVIPTIYKGVNYNFEITTLQDDGKKFNVSFLKDGKSYTTDFKIENDKIYPITTNSKSKFYSKNEDDDEDESFLSCVAGHEGAGVALLTSACAGISSFIPFLQPLAFACAAETAVTAAIISADCAGAF